MDQIPPLIGLLATFFLIALASERIGRWFRSAALPLITGFLITGMVAGPSVLGLVPAEALPRLRFVDEISLAFIAFAAGGELYVKELRGRFAGIAWITGAQLAATIAFGTLAIVLLGERVPFLASLSTAGQWSVALLAAAILLARSPSSAIAVVKELRAKGPFTQTTLGVTMTMDVLVIVIFSGAAALTDAVLAGLAIDPGFAALLLGELAASIVAGYVIYWVLAFLLARGLPLELKTAGLLLVGYGVFFGSDQLRAWTHAHLPFEVLLEPLFICMVAGVLVTNRSAHRGEFSLLLHRTGPAVYTVFFTLTGASLALGVIVKTWQVALALVVVRLVAGAVGSWGGGALAGEPRRYNRWASLAYVTQAGVGLGLAKQVAGEFPAWGDSFAAVMIAVIVLNQLVGPPLMKLALHRVGESHARRRHGEREGPRRALVLGLEDHGLALAGQLEQHGWHVRIASRRADKRRGTVPLENVDIADIDDLSLETLRALGAADADAIVCLMADEENERICELAYEHFGTETLVARVERREIAERLHELGVLVVDPAVALVSLLDHLVRSPVATSLLLGTAVGEEIVDYEVRSPELAGVALRDLRLPLDSLVISVRRDDRLIVSHGYTRLQPGDRVSVLVGSPQSARDLELKFE
jgi:Trk K+ transport system NAD-binding subunit/Kef-type K+ transport system membrane component KefB